MSLEQNTNRWTDGVIPFDIDTTAFPPGGNKDGVIQQAIRHWNSLDTPIFLRPKVSTDADFASFRPATGSCGTFAGRQSGANHILCDITNGFFFGEVAHEIGHEVGFGHEQKRSDRDQFVTINTANIQSSALSQFTIDNGRLVGPYDLASLMHYPRNAFSANGLDTIVPNAPNQNAVIGNTANGLSEGDVAAARNYYAQKMDILVHLQSIGDVTVTDGAAIFAGTRGQSRRLEGFQIDFRAPLPAGVSLEYMAHLADAGDLPFQALGTFCGTRGQSRRVEGFAIRLTGPNASKFDVYYMAHLEALGDTPTRQNGEFCGTRGQGRRVEGMRVWVLPKFQGSMRAMVHLQNIGDVSPRRMGLVGSRGQARRLEGFAINIDLPIPGVTVEYMAHLQGIGDTQFFAEGQFCGTRGESRRVEGIGIRLTGPNSGNFDVSYLGHVESIGDTAIARNGEFCGTRGQSRRLEGFSAWITRR